MNWILTKSAEFLIVISLFSAYSWYFEKITF